MSFEPVAIQRARRTWKTFQTLNEGAEPGLLPETVPLILNLGQQMGDVLDAIDEPENPVPREVWEVLSRWLESRTPTTEYWNSVAEWYIDNCPGCPGIERLHKRCTTERKPT